MLGFFIKRNIVKKVKQLYQELSFVYIEDSKKTYQMLIDVTYGEQSSYFDYGEKALKRDLFNYNNKVFERAIEELNNIDSLVRSRARLAVMSPKITGLPENIVKTICEVGHSPASIYALLYYSVTGKPIDFKKDYKRICSLLDWKKEFFNTITDQTIIESLSE